MTKINTNDKIKEQMKIHWQIRSERKRSWQNMGKEVKLLKRLGIIIILGIMILFNVLTIQNEAVNKTNQTSKNVTNTTNTTNTTKQTTDTTNADLINLGITPHDFTGFTPTTTWYEVEVPENTKTIEVYAKAQVAKAKITGTGKKDLQKGKNNLEVVVTAPSGNKKTYTICVTRGEKTEQGGNTSANEGLSELKINNLNITPEFETNVYEYTVKYIGEESKLNIETKTTKEDYVVEITGNENLKEGENIVTILVSKSNGDNIATYQITINKKLIDEEAIQKEAIQRKKMQKITIAVVGAIIVMVAIGIIIRYQKNRKKEAELSRAYFYGSDEEDEDEYEENEKDFNEEEEIEAIEEIPKALKIKQEKDQESEENEEEQQDKQEERENSIALVREQKNVEIEKEEEEEEEEEQVEQVEKMSKEKIKEMYLNNYSNQEDEYELEKHKERNKGKRFK